MAWFGQALKITASEAIRQVWHFFGILLCHTAADSLFARYGQAFEQTLSEHLTPPPT